MQENIALPLLYMGVPKQERQRRVEEAMARMDIMHRHAIIPVRFPEDSSSAQPSPVPSCPVRS